MAAIAFEVGHRTTHGYPLILALLTAALLGFVVEVTRPVATSPQPQAPEQPAETAEPVAAVT